MLHYIASIGKQKNMPTKEIYRLEVVPINKKLTWTSRLFLFINYQKRF